jgi:hypothetical protein
VKNIDKNYYNMMLERLDSRHIAEKYKLPIGLNKKKKI